MRGRRRVAFCKLGASRGGVYHGPRCGRAARQETAYVVSCRRCADRGGCRFGRGGRVAPTRWQAAGMASGQAAHRPSHRPPREEETGDARCACGGKRCGAKRRAKRRVARRSPHAGRCVELHTHRHRSEAYPPADRVCPGRLCDVRTASERGLDVREARRRASLRGAGLRQERAGWHARVHRARRWASLRGAGLRQERAGWHGRVRRARRRASLRGAGLR